MDLQASAQLPESFPHAPNSNARRACRGHLRLFLWRYALASILDLYANVTVAGGDPNPGCRALRMAMNIRETLLHGPENRRFRLAPEPFKIRWDLQIHLDLAPFGESIDVPTEGRCKSRFVQQRGMQQMGNRADLSTEFLYQSSTIVKRISGFHEAFDVGSHRAKVHSQRRQHLPHAIVQLTGDAPPLIILQLHQTR